MRGKHKRDSAKYLFPTIAYQIATRLQGLRERIGEAVENDLSVFDKSLDTQAQTLILDPLRATLADSSASVGASLVVIDGFDDCSTSSTQIRVLSCIIDLFSV